jgi:hypothetical protein
MAITSIRNILLTMALYLTVALPITAHSTIISFHFTGNIMIASGSGTECAAPFNNIDEFGSPIWLTPISASLNYNTVSGFGGSDLSITMPSFLGSPATLHDITLKHETSTNLIQGNILVDWSGNLNMPMHIEWDATGLLNAITYNLKTGDTISGTTLKQDTNGDGNFDTFNNVFSATPYSDTLWDKVTFPLPTPEGPAPLAATSSSLGLGFDIDRNFIGGTTFDGIAGLINIGSGNSLTVTSISTVPVPTAIWLFASGLIGLIGVARRKA